MQSEEISSLLLSSLLFHCLRLTLTITTDRRLRSNDAVCPLWALKSCMLHMSQREWEWETSVTLTLELAISSSNNSHPSISSHWTEVIIRLLRNSGQLTHPANFTMKDFGRNCFTALDASQANPECPRRGREYGEDMLCGPSTSQIPTLRMAR